MGITVNDLLDMGLSPQEFMAACVILTKADRDLAVCSTSDIAKAVGLTMRQTQRLISGLIEKGLLTRIERGIYRISLPEDATSVSPEDVISVAEATSVSPRIPVYMTTSHSDMTIKTPNGVLIGGFAPSTGGNPQKGERMGRYEDPDEIDTAGIGRIEAPPKPTKRKPTKAVPSLHRHVPREDWDMNFVAKEFKHRYQPIAMRRNLIGGGGDKQLGMILRKWQADYGLTPQQAATLCDDFFADEREVARISNDPPAFRQWLNYVKKNFDRVNAPEISSADIARVEAQEVPF